MENAERFVDAVLAALEEELDDAEPREVSCREEHSNDIAEVDFADGRTLMVKRAAYPEAAERFRVSRLASELLRKRAGVVAPRHLDLPLRLDSHPVEAYWRIPYPTLRRRWPELGEAERTAALRDWGRLLRRMHTVRLPGHGGLPDATGRPLELAEHLAIDLEDRLRPAVDGAWPHGAKLVDRLLDAVPRVEPRVRNDAAVLVHNDVWTGNVLCRVERGGLRCVGVLDLEDAFAGPPEAELAKTQVLHGPLFDHELDGPWFERVLEGYDAPVDRGALAFFRAYHLLNMGYHAATMGYEAHARDVARTALEEIDALGSADRDRPAGRL